MVFIPALKKKIWAGYLPPFEDELLSSWISRIAVAHYTTPHEFAREYAQLPASISRSDIDMHPPEQLIESIIEWTPLLPDETEQMLLRSYFKCGSVDSRTESAIVLKIQKRHRRSYIPAQLYCPGCIGGEKKYFKKLWRLSMSVACTGCGLRLRESCPRCMRPILFYKDGTHIRKYEMPTLSSDGILCCCGSDLCTGTREEASPLELDYQLRIERRLLGKAAPEMPEGFTYFSMLLDLAEKIGRSHSLTRSKALINRHFGTELPCHNNPLSQWELAGRREILPYADELLNNWPAHSGCIAKSRYYKNTEPSSLPHWFSTFL